MKNPNLIDWPTDISTGFIDKNEKFVIWANQYIKNLSNPLRNELHKFDDKNLIIHILEACYSASQYSPSKDASAKERRNDAYSTAEIKAQLTAIKQLRTYAKNYQKAADAAGYRAYLNLKEIGIFIQFKGEKEKRMHELLDNLLDSYADALQKPLLGIGSNSFLHRFTYGCLKYDDPVKSGRPPSKQLMLIFNLALLFRKYSEAISSGQNLRWQTGEPMPKDGKPSMRLVAELASKTLNKTIHVKKAQKQLYDLTNRNPTVSLIPWPNQ